MSGKFSEKPYQPEKEQHPRPLDWDSQNNMDYTTPYPCGVCRRLFTSRESLATHSHKKVTA